MKKTVFALVVLAGLAATATAQSLQKLEAKRVHLPNGWNLTPAGKSLPLGDLPLNLAVSRSKKYLAVTNNGQSVQSLQLIDVASETILDNVVIPKSWLGLKFSADEKYLYASGGNDNRVLQYAVQHNKLVLTDSFALGKKWPVKISPSGLDIDDRKHLLYITTKENSSLYIVDLLTKQTQQLQLPAEAYTCLLSTDKKELYISCWGCDKVLILNTESRQFTAEIPVGDNPNDLCLTKKGQYLYVANANDNSVSVLDIKKRVVLETLNAALYPDAPNGSTSNALALSADEKTLYIANADNNCLAVFDVRDHGHSKSKGFIPTGWYPTAVKVINRQLFVANGKGFSSMANPYGPNPMGTRQQVNYQGGDAARPKEVQYIAGLFKGTLSILPEPGEKQLADFSQAVYHNTPYHKENELAVTGIEDGNPIPHKIGQSSPIKYVFYIIKENRTYDQVLGDMPGGNGDTSLVLFGKHITPNLHAIAGEFVLLDNFYCDGEVSADGHNWSMGAYATDYLEKNWPSSYGGRGGTYPAEGNMEIANNKGGFIWDHCKRAGISYRSYGEFADNYKPNIPVLKNHICPYYTGWDLGTYDTIRFGQWRRDFDSLLAAHALPQFNTVRFGNDHTEGLKLGKLTPIAHAADNDQAVGMFIEYLSKSPVWKESAVFVIEDDAQNGPDHVDAHRTTAYVAGGFVKRGFVDHTMYSTSSMLRTMELILGIPPMSQYDAAATPMWRSFSATPDLTPYHLRALETSITDRNGKASAWQRKSETFDFSQEDKIPDEAFTEVIWKAIKGEQAIVPAPRRAAFVKVTKQKDDDD